MNHLWLKRTLPGVAVLMALAASGRGQTAGAPGAAGDNPTAYSAVRLVGKTLGRDAMERITEVSGREGGPQPYLWKIVLKEEAGSREVDVAGGKITAQRALAGRPAAGPAIRLADLNLDSSGAFDAAETQARKVHLRFDSLNYDLRVSEETGKPVWRLELLDKEGAGVGTLRLAAHDGSTLTTAGRLASNPPPAATPLPRPVAAQTPPPRPRLEPREPRTTTTVVTTTTATAATNTVRPAPPVEDDNDRPVPADPAVHDVERTEEGGLFTRTGRTIDHTNRRVEHSLRKAGATVQRFFTGHSSLDQGDPAD